MENKKFTLDELNALTNRISEEDFNPGSIRNKYKTKDVVEAKKQQLINFLDEHRPDIKDKEAFDKWSSIKNRLTKSMNTGKMYADTLPNQGKPTNFDALNKGEAVKIAAQDPAAKILEQEASQIDPLQFREAQRSLKTSAPNIMDVQKLDIEGAKRAALAKMAGKEAGALGKAVKGGGKIAAIGAALGAAGSAMAGEPVDTKTLLRGAGEALTPIPLEAAMGSMSEDVQLSPEELAQYRQEGIEKSNEAKRKLEERNVAALNFGDQLSQMRDNADKERRDRIQKVMSSRKNGNLEN